MILLVTPKERASKCAVALSEATGEALTTAETLSRATTLLRAESYRAVVLDRQLLETEPHEAEIMLDHLGAAILVEVNLAITGRDRLVREVRAAFEHRQREEARARRAAIGQLHHELNGTVTALLLSSELGVKIPGLPPSIAEKLGSVHALAQKLRQQLESSEPARELERATRA
jgi:type II secretory pathway component PulJ